MAEGEEGEKASWNFSADHAKLVFSLLSRSQICYSKGDLGNWFENLRAIWEQMNYNLKDATIEKIDADISYITKRQRFWNKSIEIKNKGLSINLTRKEQIWKMQYIEGIRAFQRNLMRILKKAGYLTNKIDESNVDM